MKTKILFLISLLALLLVSTSILADGRPTGIRIGRAVSGGGLTVEIDATITDTYSYYGFDGDTAWLGNNIRTFTGDQGWQYASSSLNVPSPWAVDWGDGSYLGNQVLFGSSGSPFRGTFSHTYAVGGTYMITIGDAACCGADGEFFDPIYTGNLIIGDTRYVWTDTAGQQTFDGYDSPILLAITANATVTTGAGIPALNIYGLLAMSLILVGTGVLVFRRPRRTVV